MLRTRERQKRKKQGGQRTRRTDGRKNEREKRSLRGKEKEAHNVGNRLTLHQKRLRRGSERLNQIILLLLRPRDRRRSSFEVMHEGFWMAISVHSDRYCGSARVLRREKQGEVRKGRRKRRKDRRDSPSSPSSQQPPSGSHSPAGSSEDRKSPRRCRGCSEQACSEARRAERKSQRAFEGKEMKSRSRGVDSLLPLLR